MMIVTVEIGIQVANGSPAPLIHQSDQPGPQRRHRARSANLNVLPIDADKVPRFRVGITRHIWNPTTDVLVVDRGGNMRIFLPRGKAEEIADPATCRALSNGRFIPDYLAGDAILRPFKPRTATTQSIRTGRRKIDMCQLIASPVA